MSDGGVRKSAMPWSDSWGQGGSPREGVRYEANEEGNVGDGMQWLSLLLARWRAYVGFKDRTSKRQSGISGADAMCLNISTKYTQEEPPQNLEQNDPSCHGKPPCSPRGHAWSPTLSPLASNSRPQFEAASPNGLWRVSSVQGSQSVNLPVSRTTSSASNQGELGKQVRHGVMYFSRILCVRLPATCAKSVNISAGLRRCSCQHSD